MKKIICFDVNGTLIDGKTWDVLTGGRKDIEEKIKELFNRYYGREIKVEEAWRGFVSILRKEGMSGQDYIYNCCKNEKSFKEGAEDLMLYLKQKEYRIYLVSCSIDVHLEGIVEKMNLDGMYAGSHLIFDDSGELSSIETECVKEGEFKTSCLSDLAQKEGVDIKDIVFVGDGNNDIGPFKMTGRGIAIGDNKELIAVSWKQIKNLSQIKEIL